MRELSPYTHSTTKPSSHKQSPTTPTKQAPTTAIDSRFIFFAVNFLPDLFYFITIIFCFFLRYYCTAFFCIVLLLLLAQDLGKQRTTRRNQHSIEGKIGITTLIYFNSDIFLKTFHSNFLFISFQLAVKFALLSLLIQYEQSDEFRAQYIDQFSVFSSFIHVVS